MTTKNFLIQLREYVVACDEDWCNNPRIKELAETVMCRAMDQFNDTGKTSYHYKFKPEQFEDARILYRCLLADTPANLRGLICLWEYDAKIPKSGFLGFFEKWHKVVELQVNFNPY